MAGRDLQVEGMGVAWGNEVVGACLVHRGKEEKGVVQGEALVEEVDREAECPPHPLWQPLLQPSPAVQAHDVEVGETEVVVEGEKWVELLEFKRKTIDDM